MPSWQAIVASTVLKVSNRIFIRNHTTIEQMRQVFNLTFGMTSDNFKLKFPDAHVSVVESPAGEWIYSKDVRKDRVFLYLHGGGYVFGSIDCYRRFSYRLSRITNRTVFCADYALAPEKPFPAALNDCFAAYRYLLSQGYEAENIVIGGDSAGGGLTLATLFMIRDNKLPLPRAGICFSPWADLTLSGESSRFNVSKEVMVNPIHAPYWVNSYAGDAHRKDPLVSPLFGDFTGLPPLLIQVSDSEAIYNDSTRVADRAQKAGVEVTLQVFRGLPHAWHILARILPEAQEALRDVNDFLNSLESGVEVSPHMTPAMPARLSPATES